MHVSLADDINKNIVIYVNDFYPEFANAFKKLSGRLNRPLRGILLVDAERKSSGKYRSDKEGIFEEIVVDFSDDGALRKAIKPLESQLLLISCDSERSQLYFKRVIPHVPYVNTPTESSLFFSTDKGKMRELLASYDPGISPKAVVVQDASPKSVRRVMEELNFPLIVKPTNLAASRLVNKATSENELRQLLERSFASLDQVYSLYRGLGSKTMVVEEFVEGDLYSTDAYVDSIGKVYVLPFIHFQNGMMAGLEGYQEYQRETYLTLSDQEIKEGIIVAEKAVHAIGLRSSVAHIELFHTTNGWKIVELGARPGGWRQEMYAVSFGIDHALNELLIKIGLEPEMPIELKTHSAMFCIDASKAGIVDSIIGVEEAQKHRQMDKIQVNIKPGDKVVPTSHGGELIIEGLMHNKDHEQLNRDITAMRDSIRVSIK